jgi:hypothetical protein
MLRIELRWPTHIIFLSENGYNIKLLQYVTLVDAQRLQVVKSYLKYGPPELYGCM